MATYELTPNIGLKNIDIGSFPWGAEERENKIILDSVIGGLSVNGKLNLSLYPADAILQDSNVSLSRINGIECLAFNNSIDSSAMWFLSGSETNEYIGQKIPFLALGTFTGVNDTNLLEGENANIIDEIEIGDTINTGHDTLLVTNVANDRIILESNLTEAITNTRISVIPKVARDRIIIHIYWLSSGSGMADFKCGIRSINAGDPIENTVDTYYNFESIETIQGNDLNISRVSFSPLEIELISGKPAIFTLRRGIDSIENAISIIGVDISLARGRCVPSFTNTYNNVTSNGELSPQQVDYTYNSNGDIIQSIEQIYGELRTTIFNYDSQGNISQQIAVYQGITTTDTYIYDANGNISQTLSTVSI